VPQKLLKVIFLSHKVTFSAEIWLWTFEWSCVHFLSNVDSV
jgi:hypothetical protein